MTLCMHVATKDVLIVCSDGKVLDYLHNDDGSKYITNIIYDDVKSYFYNDIAISCSGSSFNFEGGYYSFEDFFSNLYKSHPHKFNIREFPSFLSSYLWGSNKYDFKYGDCIFLISGLSLSGEFYTYAVSGRYGQITNLSQFNSYATIGVTRVSDAILSDLIIPELSTKSVLEILKFIAKTYCNYGELRFEEMFDSKGNYSDDYGHHTSVGGKWIFYVLDFKTKKGKYVKFCLDGKIRYYSKLVQNEFK